MSKRLKMYMRTGWYWWHLVFKARLRAFTYKTNMGFGFEIFYYDGHVYLLRLWRVGVALDENIHR